MDTQKEIINTVYTQLKTREINPGGTFDSGGRFYLTNSELVDVRTPSGAWPYSELVAGRTKKYVKKVAEKFECSTIDDLLQHV